MAPSSRTEQLLEAKRKYSEKPVLRRETTWKWMAGVGSTTALAGSTVSRLGAGIEDETVRLILVVAIGAGLLVLLLAVVLVCVVALTGPIYKNRLDFKRGELEVWNWEDKTVAAIILALLLTGAVFLARWVLF
jgi:hypothetical protein